MSKTQDKAKTRPANAGFTKAGRNSKSGGKKRGTATTKPHTGEHLFARTKADKLEKKSFPTLVVEAAQQSILTNDKLYPSARNIALHTLNLYRSYSGSLSQRLEHAKSATRSEYGINPVTLNGITAARIAIESSIKQLHDDKREESKYMKS